MKLSILILLVALLTFSCVGDAKESVQDGDFKIELLFEKDGCKMYRFSDGGRNIYWSNCSGKLNYDFTQSNGKTTHQEHGETITTQ